MKKIVLRALIIIYIILIIFIPFCLIKTNNYNIVDFNKYYLLTLNNYGYNKNNLLLIKKSNNLQVNDDVLFLENNKIKQGSIEEIIENKYILSNKKVVD